MEKFRANALLLRSQLPKQRLNRHNSWRINSTSSTNGDRRSKSRRKYSSKSNSAVTNFRRAVKIVQVVNMLRIANTNITDELSKVDTYITFTEFANEMHHKSSTTLFDPTLYRANKEMRISSEVRTILMLPQADKTKAHIDKALLALRGIKAFAEYPTRMQRRLVEVGWYERHTTKRMILRQGHPPMSFYFILSGRAVVKVLSVDDKLARTICYLKRGDSFGELSIIHSINRQATIISEECIELLCISKKDFVEIFMSSGLGGINLYGPDFAQFISEIKFLRNWPLHLLHNHPKHCLFNYFKSDTVLVRDSKYSDWIYIIKSGSCRVLIKLDSTTNKVSQNMFYIRGKNVELQKRRNCQKDTHSVYNKGYSMGVTLRNTHLTNSNRPRTSPPKSSPKNKLENSVHAPNDKISIIDSSIPIHMATQDSRNEDTKCFVKIAILEKGDTFGLQSIFCRNQPSLILISNGTEILMISKKHFLKNCTQEFFCELERTVPKYPSTTKLQQQLQGSIRWKDFTRNEMLGVVGRIKSAKT